MSTIVGTEAGLRVSRLRILNSEEDFAKLAGAWDDLVASCGARGPFATHHWLQNWWSHFGHGRELLIPFGEVGDSLSWALALSAGPERLAGFKVRVVRSLTNVHSGPLDALVSPGAEADARSSISRFLRDQISWDVLVVDYLPENGHLRAWLAQEYPCYVRDGLHSPYILLKPDFDAYLRTRSRHFRQLLRRKIRKALATPGFEIRTWGPGEKEEDFWDALERVENRSWKSQVGTAITSDPVVTRYYRSLVSLAAERGWAYFTWSRIRGEAAAFDLAMAFGDTVFSMKISYDPQFSQLSPGVVTKAITLKRCCEDGYREHDLMGHIEPWKVSYTPLVRRHVTLYVFNPRSPKARALWRLWFRPRRSLGNRSVIGKLIRSTVGARVAKKLGLR